MIKKVSITVVVVTFNNRKDLIDCLLSVLRQSVPPSAIILINNSSSDDTEEFLYYYGFLDYIPLRANKKFRYQKKIIRDSDREVIYFYYYRFSRNVGGAGGFHFGIKLAYVLGADWIWTLDDDVEPSISCLKHMLKYTVLSLCIHPSKKYKDGTIFVWDGLIDIGSGYVSKRKSETFRLHKDWTVVNYACFEGMLIHRSIVQKISFPIREFYLYGDDTLYGYLASDYTNVIYLSEFGLIKKKYSKEASDPQLFYYWFRNHIFIAKKVSQSKKLFWLLTIFKGLSYVIKYTINFRFRFFYYTLIALYDGIRSNLTRNVKD